MKDHLRVLLKGAPLYLLLLGIPVQLPAQEQRFIDLEVQSIAPAGDVVNGQSLPLKFKWTNHGPDAWQHGDSVIYILYSMEEGEQDIFYAGLLYNSFADYDSGQTAQYNDPYNITFNYPGLTAPKTIDFCVSFYTRVELQGGDSLILSWDDPDINNNTSCQQVTVYPQSTGIAGTTDAGNGFAFYPNPATDRVTLIMNGQKENAVISLRDISGRQVLQKNTGNMDWIDGTQQLDISQYPAGIYLLTVATAQQKATGKLVIEK